MKLIIIVAIVCVCQGQLVLNPESKRCLVDQTLYKELQLIKCEMMRMKEQLSETRESLTEAKQSLANKIDQVDASVGELQTGVNQVNTDKDNQQKSAFLAYDIKHRYGDDSYSVGDRIIYTSTRFNAGGHYSQFTGKYTCPVTGLYYMSYSVYGTWIEDGWINSRATASLMKGGVELGQVYTSNHNPEKLFITLSQSLVLHCTAGEKVWVESRHPNNNLYGYDTRNVFSGFLLASG